MLSNYLKISIAVLLRRKFLTFVNVFGATLTLTVLVVAFAIVDSSVNPQGAQRQLDNILTIDRLQLTNSRFNRNWRSFLGYAFYQRHIATLQTPDRVSYSTLPNSVTSYVDGRKVSTNLRRTDAEYWEILRFDVVDGRTLSPDDVALGRSVAVINSTTAENFFPNGTAVGSNIALGNETFEVVGVVSDEPETSQLAFSDAWVPVSTIPEQSRDWVGGGQAMLYLNDPSRAQLVREEFQDSISRFEPITEPAALDVAASRIWTGLELFARASIGSFLEVDFLAAGNVISQFVAIAIVTALLFMALPAINMANLNVGRILERAPEIGLRKAAGASTAALIGQFIFENIVLSLLGGVLAFAVAPIVLGILNDTVFNYGQLSLNPTVLAAGLAFIVLFGVLSGAYPAWKMAKLQPANCLRGLHHA